VTPQRGIPTQAIKKSLVKHLQNAILSGHFEEEFA
jgi:hypothetical protein